MCVCVCVCVVSVHVCVWCRFYSRSSSYVHGGLDSGGKPEEAVYGQAVSAPAVFSSVLLTSALKLDLRVGQVYRLSAGLTKTSLKGTYGRYNTTSITLQKMILVLSIFVLFSSINIYILELRCIYLASKII